MIPNVDIQLGRFCPPVPAHFQRVCWDDSLWSLREGRMPWGPEWQILAELGGLRTVVGSWTYGESPLTGGVSVVAGGFTLFQSRECALPTIRSAMDGRSMLLA